eukprot:CAMPEP_0185740834 /NCGR_PEP_ID=MMETSP1171-20130828/38636_1 /TAXON_ID=374046 /ORGANISM="Helicotheca tamensis, Strain CCMP826" /LENGTH=177 /DNA_ID=CAMNT_0028412763 /DNA_START=27 /DNA_END=560 /DNA_ORIENTATION=-
MGSISIAGVDVPYTAIVSFLIVIVSSILFLGSSGGSNSTPDAAPREAASSSQDTSETTTGIRSASKNVSSVSTMSQWKDALNEAEGDVVVLFAASWSKPCQKIVPFYEELAEIYDAKFILTDVDELSALAKKHDVNMMPTFMLFKAPHGGVLETVSGANKDKIENILKLHCGVKPSS